MGLKQSGKAVVFGAGKMHRHIPYLFNNLSSQFSFINSKSFSLSSEEKSTFQDSKFIFLAVPDGKIESAYRDLKDQSLKSDQIFIHLSGIYTNSQIIGIHPLMSFNQLNYNLDYELVPLFCDSEVFISQFLSHDSRCKFIEADQKAIYHSMASMLGNFTQYYLQTLKNNFPQFLDINDFRMLVQKSVNEVFEPESELRLTGPMVRKDLETIRSQKKSIAETKLATIYNNMEKIFNKELFNENL